MSALQSALERSQASEAALTSRVAELTSQLASSGVEGGSLRAQNGELLAELAALRWGTPHGFGAARAGLVGGGCVANKHKWHTACTLACVSCYFKPSEAGLAGRAWGSCVHPWVMDL